MGVGRNLYVDLDAFKRAYANNQTLDASDVTEIEREIERASREVDDICQRPDGFFATTDTRYFSGGGRDYICIPDLLAATSVKLDEDGNRTFELTLSALTDYFLKRYGYPDEDAKPYTRLVLDAVSGRRSAFLSRDRLVEIAGRWGFSEDIEVVQASGTAITGTLTDAADLTLDVSANADLAIGQTLLLESEQVYISGGTTSPFTVIRAVNGTTAAAHVAVAVNRYKYPAKVREVALELAGKAWMRRNDPSRVVAGTPLAGTDRRWAQQQLAALTRWSGMVA